jgi:dienelactone hydrolase
MASATAAQWTGAPLQLQVGGQDDYDNADGGASCRRLVANLPPDKQQRVELIVYPQATHAWEQKLPRPISFDDPLIRRNVRVAPDTAAAAEARAATVAFFKTALGS